MVQIRRNDTLPLLAWLVDVDKSTGDISIYCGNNVEVRDNFLVSGVWSGPFEEGGFDHSDVFFGTGAKWEEEKICFYTPSHALERLVALEREQDVIVSNSIGFLMAFADVKLDNRINQYEKIFCSMLKGPLGIQNEIPMEGQAHINQYIVGSIVVEAGVPIRYQRREKVQPFGSYSEYYSRMMRDMEQVRENSISPFRTQHSYGLVTTISSGYDSSANAAIAAKIGCTTAVSLSGGVYDEDDGSAIANQLGYERIVKKNRYSYKAKAGLIDAEYNGSGELGKHQQFSVFEEEFRGNLVFMGTRGDYYWGKETVANNDFNMIGFYYYETDVSYTENALRNGYIVVAMATYGSSASTSLREVMLSADMKPWTLGTTYDRPIPRRILEESGVQRESFGQKKYGGGFSFCYDTIKTLSQKMTQDGFNSFSHFYSSTRKERYTLRRAGNRVVYFVLNIPLYINCGLKYVGLKSIFKTKPLKMANPGAPLDLLFWSIEEMKKVYCNALVKEP